MTSADSILLDALDAALPQTQCTRCGFPSCRAYAEAVARGDAHIAQCPPGGDTTVALLAQALGVPQRPLDPAFGTPELRARAVIDERACIGCRKCLDVCPTDAIVGAAKQLHAVLADDCTGCGLCLPPCPVDCIALEPAKASGPGPWREYGAEEVARWRALARRRAARVARANSKTKPPARPDGRQTDRARIRAEIRAAVARVRSRRLGGAPHGR